MCLNDDQKMTLTYFVVMSILEIGCYIEKMKTMDFWNLLQPENLNLQMQTTYEVNKGVSVFKAISL